MSHWAVSLIGTPWVNGDHDCWVFFRQVQKEHFDVEVPPVDVDAMNVSAVSKAFRDHDERANWTQVTLPREGDAVLMAHSRFPSHVGTWLDVDGGGVLHCAPKIGVIFSSPQQLQAAGWGRILYYRRIER